MKHVLEYNLFESKADPNLFSSELTKRFPRLPGSIKKEFKFFLNRSWEGRFDVIDTPEGVTHLSLEFPNSDLPELIFEAFYIPKDAKTLFDLKPIDKQLMTLLNEDAESLNKIARKINSELSSDTDKIPENVTGGNIRSIIRNNDYMDSYSKWPGLENDEWYPRCYKYMHAILDKLKEIIFAKAKIEKEEVSHDQIKKIPEYKRAIDFGFEDESTPRILSNGNLKISHPLMAFDSYSWGLKKNLTGTDAFTIYSSGPIRITSAGNPTVIGSAPGYPIKNQRDWGNKILWVLEYLKRRILKDEFGVTSRNEQERVSKLPDNLYYQYLLEKDPEKFFQYVDSSKPHVRKSIFSGGLLIKDLIEKDPQKAVFTFKKYYKNPEIRAQIEKLPPEIKDEFEKNIELTGNLGELGF